MEHLPACLGVVVDRYLAPALPGLGEEGTASGLIMDIADDKSQPRRRPGFRGGASPARRWEDSRLLVLREWGRGGYTVTRVQFVVEPRGGGYTGWPSGGCGMGDGGIWCSCEGGLWGDWVLGVGWWFVWLCFGEMGGRGGKG